MVESDWGEEFKQFLHKIQPNLNAKIDFCTRYNSRWYLLREFWPKMTEHGLTYQKVKQPTLKEDTAHSADAVEYSAGEG